MDMPIIAFDWPAIVECVKLPLPDPPTDVPQSGQSTDAFIANYHAAQLWGMKFASLNQCRTALDAWMAGWEAGHAGKPKDPTVK